VPIALGCYAAAQQTGKSLTGGGKSFKAAMSAKKLQA
jgi:hypothetical protein